MSVPQKIGRYEILEEIGRGAMGAVYKARDPNIGRVVAIKTILASALTGPMADEYRMRFLREARAAGNLAHPGIVTVFDVDEHQGTSFLVMEFVQGRTLASALDVGERFPFSSIYDLGGQVADALGYAHAHGVVHRDVKPANILLTAAPGGKPESMAKIADFGVAKLSSSQITTVQQMLGTPAFMSPEQCTGSPLDGRSDLFSLGVILYWMATGDKPFVGETLTALSYKIVHTEPIPPRALNPGIPARLEQIILKALAKSPDTRYAAGVELALDLRALADPGTIRARPDAIGARVPDPPERHSRPDDETTPLLGQRRPPAPTQSGPARMPSGPATSSAPPASQPPKAPALDNETVAHRQPPRQPTPPLAPPQHHPPQPPTRLEPEPPRTQAETPSRVETPPPSHRNAPLPPSHPDRAWYEPESATRMLDAASHPAAQDSFIRHAAQRPATHTPRSYTRIIVALAAVLSVAVLAAIFWPRPQAPASDQNAANIAPSQPNPAAQPSPQTTAPSRDPSTPVEPSSLQPESTQPPAPMPSGPAKQQPAPRTRTAATATDDRVSAPPSQVPPPSQRQNTQPAPTSTPPPPQPAPRTASPESSTPPPPQKQSQPSSQGTQPASSQLSTPMPSGPAPTGASANPAAPSTPPSESAPPPKATTTAPAKSPDPAPATRPASNTTAPAKSAPSRPSLTAGQNPAKLRIIALTVPNEMDFILHDGSVVILTRPAVARAGSRDILEVVDVPSGPRTLRVTLRIPGSGLETTKTARERLKPSSTHLLEIEVRGVGNAGRPRFDLKFK